MINSRKLTIKNGFSFFWLAGTVFMVVTMFIPTSFAVLRLALIVLWFLALLVDVNGNRRRIRFQKTGYVILFVYMVYMILSSIYGFFNHEFDSFRMLRPYVIFPLIYVIIFSSFKGEKDIRYLKKVMLFAETLNCIYDLWFCLYGMGIISWLPSIFMKFGLEPIFNGKISTYYQYTTTHMVTHIFMVPFTMVLFLNSITKRKIDVKLAVLFAMQLICVYLSGRASFQLTTVVSVGGLLVYNLFIRKRKRYTGKLNRRMVLRVLAIVAIGIFAIFFIIKVIGLDKNISGVIDYIMKKLQRTYTHDTSVGDIRSKQRVVYIKGWLDSPWIGKGMGAYSTDIDRGSSGYSRYATELTYVHMLFQYGLLGTALFFSIVIGTIIGLCKKERNKILSYETTVPFLFGMIAILLASAVDPYLFTFGCVWMLFLPFVIAFGIVNEEGESHYECI